MFPPQTDDFPGYSEVRMYLMPAVWGHEGHLKSYLLNVEKLKNGHVSEMSLSDQGNPLQLIRWLSEGGICEVLFAVSIDCLYIFTFMLEMLYFT